MDTKKHICNRCEQIFPTCNHDKVLFGNGFGNDNVIACSGFKDVNSKIVEEKAVK